MDGWRYYRCHAPVETTCKNCGRALTTDDECLYGGRTNGAYCLDCAESAQVIQALADLDAEAED